MGVSYNNERLNTNKIPNELLDEICTKIEIDKGRIPFKYRGIRITKDLVAVTLEILNEAKHNELPQNCRNQVADRTEDGLDRRIKERTQNNLRTANIISDVLADINVVRVFKSKNPKTGRLIKWTRSFVNW